MFITAISWEKKEDKNQILKLLCAVGFDDGKYVLCFQTLSSGKVLYKVNTFKHFWCARFVVTVVWNSFRGSYEIKSLYLMFKSISLHYYIRLILTKHLSSCKYKFGSRTNGIVKYTLFADFCLSWLYPRWPINQYCKTCF